MRESSSRSSCSGSGASDASDFECNICFELAQDPIVTLCGHLFCWPCLYRWLRHHSHSHECPVCKALVQEERLVPIYGRGKGSTDPRSRSVPGMEIPNRPAGQRPETAPRPRPPPEVNFFPNIGLGLMGGFVPMATVRFGNVALLAAFGGLFSYLFNVQPHGFHGANVRGTAFGYPNANGANNRPSGAPQAAAPDQQRDSFLKMLFYLICAFVLFTLIWS